MSYRYQNRRATAASWTSVNPVLAAGELGVEVATDGTTRRWKMGDGVTAWTALAYSVLPLATVATTGAYADLTGKPVIPTQASDIGAQPVGAYVLASALTAGLATKADTATLTSALATKADLVGGVIPTSQIPAVALVNPTPVATVAAMLALTSTQVQPGDIVTVAQDPGRGTYSLRYADPSQLANWLLLNAPTDAVLSVNGQINTVVLGKTDIGLPNVDNTHDVDKPVSTAQAAAIAAKYTKPSGGIPAADLASDVPTAAQVTANTNSIATNTTAIAARATSAAAAFTGTQPAWTDSGGTSQTLATQNDAYGAALVFSLIGL